jgi:hypothetical protein
VNHTLVVNMLGVLGDYVSLVKIHYLWVRQIVFMKFGLRLKKQLFSD